MTQRRRGWLAAWLLAIGLAVGGILVAGADDQQTPRLAAPAGPAADPEDPNPSIGSSPTPLESTVPVEGRGDPGHSLAWRRPISSVVARPPLDAVGIGARYLARYDARRVTWDEVIDDGRPLPKVGARCAKSWRTSGRDPRLTWTSKPLVCLSDLRSGNFRPQGIAGTATTQGYDIAGQPAAERNLIVTSWYSRTREPGLFAPNRAGESVTRLVVIDVDSRRYADVELVRPDGRRSFRNLNSHGSGLAWAGQYLYASSRSNLWMFNADDLVEIDGRYVLPAVARWTAQGPGGLSSISLDRSTAPAQLVGIGYAKTSPAVIHSFDLDPNGLLNPDDPLNPDSSPNPGRPRRGDALRLTNWFGQPGPEIRSARAVSVPGTSYQGVGRLGAYSFANSSALRLGGRPVDAMTVVKNEKVIDRFRMPAGNGESIYLDDRRGRLVSLTEHGSQFLFHLPLEELTEPAQR